MDLSPDQKDIHSNVFSIPFQSSPDEMTEQEEQALCALVWELLNGEE